MIRPFAPDLAGQIHDICVIGAGPVGIALSLELARLGRRVLLLESGGRSANAKAQDLAEARIIAPAWHAPMANAVQRRLGGAGNLWGGRCVMLDPVDFIDRPHVGAPGGWPIQGADLAPFLPLAAGYADIETSDFVLPLAGPAIADPEFTADHLERWAREPRPQVAHAQRLKDSQGVDLRLGATLAALRFGPDGQVEAAIVQGPDGARISVKADRFVLACGGIENARLLLNAQADPQNGDPDRFGGEAGMLGRCYMGHLYGTVAAIEIATEAMDAAYDYQLAEAGVFVRRRFNPSLELLQREKLLNISFWPEFPPIHDPRHGDGVLSMAYLALSIPPVGRMVVAESVRRVYVGAGERRVLRHLRNIMKDVTNTATFVPRFLWRRKFSRPRQPGFFQRNAARRYAIRFHAETRPELDNRITLGDVSDAVGLRRAVVDLSFRRADVEDVLRAHALFGEWLERTGVGRMEWSAPPEDRVDHVLAQAVDGHHQIGTTRMAQTPEAGVVDRDCRVFGAANLYLAGASVFPTSSQANPTFPAILLAMRLARHLADQDAG